MATGHHLEIRESSTGSCLGNTTRGPHQRYQFIQGNWKKNLPEKSLGSVLWFFLILEIKIRLFLKADSNLQINTSVKQRSIYVGRSIFSLLRFHHVFQTKGGLLHELFHMFGVMHTQMRPDRNKYIKVHKQNIIPYYRSEYKVFMFLSTINVNVMFQYLDLWFM